MGVLGEGVEKNLFLSSTGAGSSSDVVGTSMSGSTGVSGGADVKVKLASLLPGLSRWSHLALEGLPNALVDVSVSCFLYFILFVEGS